MERPSGCVNWFILRSHPPCDDARAKGCMVCARRATRTAAAKGDGMASRTISIAAALGAMGLALSACASIIEGTTQQIVVNTSPPGADCGLYREEGVRIAAIQKTPGKALIEKTKNDIWILNHIGQTLGKNPSQASIDFYRWSDALGRPNTALALVYFFAKRGAIVRVEYSFNPVVAGFRDTGGWGWRGNPWHVGVASKDEKKLAYLRELKATGEALFEKLKGV